MSLPRVHNAADLSPPPANNFRPIIGVLDQRPEEFDSSVLDFHGDTYIDANYVRFLESAGARVVPIFVGRPQSYYESIFSKINGVLLPGGGSNVTKSLYADAGRVLYNLAVKANDAGDYFPLWGTCLGFQLLACATANDYVLNGTDSNDMTLPLELDTAYRSSRLFGNAPEKVLQYLTAEPITANFHIESLLTQQFLSNPKLNTFFRPLSYNVDKNNIAYVSTFEAFRYPFYGSQWHPEKTIFAWETNSKINHSPHAISVSQYIADFFVMEARRNKHCFPSADEEAHAMIENYQCVFSADQSYHHRYYFSLTQTCNAITG